MTARTSMTLAHGVTSAVLTTTSLTDQAPYSVRQMLPYYHECPGPCRLVPRRPVTVRLTFIKFCHCWHSLYAFLFTIRPIGGIKNE